MYIANNLKEIRFIEKRINCFFKRKLEYGKQIVSTFVIRIKEFGCDKKERKKNIEKTAQILKKVASLTVDIEKQTSVQNISLNKEQMKAILQIYHKEPPNKNDLIAQRLERQIKHLQEAYTLKGSFMYYFQQIDEIDKSIEKYYRIDDKRILKGLNTLSKIKKEYLLRMQKPVLGFIGEFNKKLEDFIKSTSIENVSREDIELMDSNYECIINQLNRYYFDCLEFRELLVSIHDKIVRINNKLEGKGKER